MQRITVRMNNTPLPGSRKSGFIGAAADSSEEVTTTRASRSVSLVFGASVSAVLRKSVMPPTARPNDSTASSAERLEALERGSHSDVLEREVHGGVELDRRRVDRLHHRRLAVDADEDDVDERRLEGDAVERDDRHDAGRCRLNI